MPQLISITSEAIQAQIRRLLPSQQGFGIDMEASSVITPIIDITPAAEGSQLPTYLQRAIAHGSNTEFSVAGTNTNFAVTPGFYNFTGVSTLQANTGLALDNKFRINDGSTVKDLWVHGAEAGGINGEYLSIQFDITCFIRQQDTINIRADSGSIMAGSYRQVADVNGGLINPVGFSFE